MNDSNTNVILTPRKAAFFCLIVFFLYFCTLKKGLEFWNIDSFYYLTLAKSLVSLNGYNILGMPHARYPFGFPCLLAPVVGIFGYNFFVIQIFLITLAALGLFVCFIFLRRSYNEKTADIAFLLTGISYLFWSGALTTQDIVDKIQKENARYALVESNKRPLIKNLREIEVFYMLNFKEIMQVEGNLPFKIEPRNLP